MPFSQNWTDAALIADTDNWSGVPGVIGYRGDDLTSATAADPRTILADGSGTPADVNANQANCDTLSTGGVTECEAVNTVALQGSGTADAPHLVFHINATGKSNVRFACNIRDVDGSADDAIQQVDVQYRLGTGNYISLTGGYVADATTAGTATQSTALDLALPADADNKALVEVRVITTNAASSDEWVGVDDVNVTASGGPVTPNDAPVDFNGDGKTDWSVVRNIGGSNEQLRWFIALNGTSDTLYGADWGIRNDTLVPEDYDGDGKDDVAIWREGASATFYILQSETNTMRVEQFGQTGDDPTVVGDYDGDDQSDVAVYRPGTQGTWFYKGSLNNPAGHTTYIPWGQNGDKVAPGDYDGDGKNDFVVRRGEGVYWQLLATGAVSTSQFGLSGDLIETGDFDGDEKTDLTAVRVEAGSALTWFVLPSGGGPVQQVTWGTFLGDYPTPGDYDGDGKTDIAIWRSGDGNFWVRNSNGGTVRTFQFGAAGDEPAALYNSH
ncbi:MAG: VCBS repeat-containing protein [Pyrinomonadaceae bacterium]